MNTAAADARKNEDIAEYLSMSATEDASNRGKILTSTLWNQRGTVYVSVNGEQTALTGYTYNQFCPDNSPSDSGKSLTGCTNTADSQIIYYWIERGCNFSLSVSSANYFSLKSNGSTYYLADTPSVGEGTISQLNSILGSSNRIGNGNFIAALNFFCGVNNHSNYSSSSTSTTWYSGERTDGTNAAAYKAAGFDSYHFVSSEYSGSVMFQDGAISAVGFSIIRENLDYGEPIRVGIPGHAIYLDGYRSVSGGYEYHLNYGWGINSSATRWYTVGELKDLKITYLTFDITPELSVMVSNNRSDYFGGSFLRGMERINNVDKADGQMRTFDFANSVAGKAIALSTSAAVTSGVGVSFTHLSSALSTTANSLFSSARRMTFSVKNGSMAVNSAGANYVVRETGNVAVSVTLNSSYIYSGYYSSGVKALDSLLCNDDIYKYSDYAGSFYATVQGSAILGGGAADRVVLSNGSAVFGNINLGAGRNTLNIENGSMYYGSFTGAANTLVANLTIKSAENTGPMIVLRDAASDAAFYTATGGKLNLSVASLPLGNYTFGLYYGTDAAAVKNFSVSVTYDGETHLLDYDHRSSGFFSVSYYGPNLSLSCIRQQPSVTSVSASTTEPTNGGVVVKAVFSANSTGKYYSRDGKTWLEYKASGVLMSKNGTVRFKATLGDLTSAVRSYTVSCIDRTPPAKPVITVSTTKPTNKYVVVRATFAEDAVKNEYRIGSGAWTVFDTKVVVRENGTISLRSIDAAGNISAPATTSITNIDKVAPNKPRVRINTNAQTMGSVRLTVTSNADAVGLQYSVDNRNWKDMSDSRLAVIANGTYYFRAVDAAGNTSDTSSFTVSNVITTQWRMDTTGIAAKKSVSGQIRMDVPGWFKLSGDFGKLTGSVILLSGSRQIASGKAANGKLTLSNDGRVLLAKGVDYTLKISNTGTAAATIGSVSVAADKLFSNGDNSDDSLVRGTSVGAIAKGKKLAANGWVGFGDSIDCYKFTLSSSAKLSLSLSATDATSFVIYDSSRKALQTTTVKASGKTVSAQSAGLLMAAGSYYLAVKSTNAAKGGDSTYNVSVGGGTVIYPAADTADNTWEAAEAKSALSLASAKKISGWVGFGNAADFVKVQVEKKGQISLDLDAATSSARSTGELKLTLLNKTGKALSLISAGGDTLSSKGKLGVGAYYVGVTCTDVMKYNTSYKITAGMLAG